MKLTRFVFTHRCVITAFIGCCFFSNAAAQKQKPPNILIVITDQWRGQALGFEHKEPVKTPNLDAFSRQSFVATQMVANYPVCSPSRAMLFTGQYPLKNHVYSNVNSSTAPDNIQLKTDAVCWSDVLKANGYNNGYIGKWHLDSPHPPYIPTSNNIGKVAWNEWTPPDRRHGFDYWYAYGTYDEHLEPMYWTTDAPRDSFHYVKEWGPSHEVGKALEFLENRNGERDGKKPFSLVVSINPPHSNYTQVPREYYELYKNIPLESLLNDPDIPPAGTEMGDFYRKYIRYYYAAITGIDDQVGRLLKGLEKLKLSDNTIVVFVADHGNCLGKHDAESKNNIYEESLRIPFMIRWAGHIKPRYDSVFLGSMPDLYPSLLTLIGLQKDIPSAVDGKSYASYWLTGKGKMPSVQYILGTINGRNPNSGFRGVRTADYKLAYVKAQGKIVPYLFDLKKDPFELKNIYDEQSSLVSSMRQQLLDWLTQNKDPFKIK
ncbi:sulfatase family protein [Niabella hirudinis]|uniref:sulfatase family protein n=1 Tax=Niabella hirudinis TaxID=1285929 RepID=UPI003EB862D0